MGIFLHASHHCFLKLTQCYLSKKNKHTVSLLKSRISLIVKKQLTKCSWNLERICCQTNSDQRISWICTITMLLHKCVSVCAQAWAGGRGVCQWRIERETDRSWWLWCELGPQKRETRWEKKQYHRTNVSLQTTTVEECVGFFLCVAVAMTRKWLTHTHSCVQMSITKSDEVQSFFFPPISSSRADKWHAFKGKLNSSYHI